MAVGLGRRRLGAAARDPRVTSRILASVRSSGTKPELALRRALRRRGARFQINYSLAVGRPDIAFPRRRVAIFVDGDFWHGRGWRERGFRSLEDQFRHWNRGPWWFEKISGNVARDRRVTRSLRRQGWRVIRFSESELLARLDRCVERVLGTLEQE